MNTTPTNSILNPSSVNDNDIAFNPNEMLQALQFLDSNHKIRKHQSNRFIKQNKNKSILKNDNNNCNSFVIKEFEELQNIESQSIAHLHELQSQLLNQKTKSNAIRNDKPISSCQSIQSLDHSNLSSTSLSAWEVLQQEEESRQRNYRNLLKKL